MTHTLPPGWEEKTLGKLCYIHIGKTPARSNIAYWDKNKETNNIWLSIADLLNTTNKQVFSSKEFLSDKGANLVPVVEPGTLLLSFKLTIGRVAFAGVPLRTNEAIAQLPIKDPQVLDKNYLYYYLQYYDYEQLLRGDVKVKGKTLNKEKLKILTVQYPSLPEQKRIVEKLDKIFATIDEAKQNIEKNLDNVKELFQRTLSHLFTHNTQGWEDKPLPDVCIFQSGTTIEKKYEKEKGDLLYVKVGDMNLPDNTFKINTSSRFALSSDISAKQILPIGAVIFPKRGGAIATNKKRQIVKPTIVDLNTMSIKCVEDIDDDFFFLWFQQIDLLSISNGTTIPQINNYSFKDLRIKYPHNIYEQKKIVNKLRILQEKVAQAQVSYTQKLADLEELKQAVLQQAFSGKL